MNYYEQYVDYVYNIVKMDCEDMDAIYADYIKQMVGVYGLNALIGNNLVESCGVVNGRLLYVLCTKEPLKNPDDYESLKEENRVLRKLVLKDI